MRCRPLLLTASVLGLLLAPATGAALIPLEEAVSLPVVAPVQAAQLVSLPEPPAHEGPAFGVDEKLSIARAPALETLPPSPASAPASLPIQLLPDDCGTGKEAGFWSNPTPLPGTGSCEGRVGGSDWWDTYSIHVEGPALLSATLTVRGSSPVLLCVYHDRYEDYYQTVRCDEATPTEMGHTATYVATPGTWHILLENQGDAVDYQLTVDIHGWTTPPDCGTTDASNQSAGALPLGFPSACEGSLDPTQDDADWYALRLEEGVAATLTVAPNLALDSDVCVYAASNLSRPLDCSILPVGKADRVLLHAPEGGGDYLIRVEWWDGAGPYQISLTSAPAPNDCATGTDGGSGYLAIAVTVPLTCAGALDVGAGDSWDVYRFTLSEQGVRVNLQAARDGVLACLYAAGNPWPVRCTTGAAGDTTLAYQTPTVGQTWRVGVIVEQGSVDYGLAILPFVPAPQDDCGTGHDAAGYSGPRAVLTGDVACVGALLVSEGDTEDAFTMRLEPSVMDVLIRSKTPTFQVCIHTSTGDNSGGGPCKTAQAGEVQFKAQMREPGNLTMIINSGEAADDLVYELQVAISPPYSDCGTAGDAPNQWQESPPRLAPPVIRCEGKLFTDSGDWTDRYLVRAEAGQSITLLVEPVEGRLWSSCIETEDDPQVCVDFGPFLLASPSVSTHPVTATGDYVISIEAFAGSPVTYRLSVIVQ